MESKLKYYGPSKGGVSRHGKQTDELKSAVQKYIRRGETEKAVWCIKELNEFATLLGSEQDRVIKAFMTNCMNRLTIISVEDVGLGNYWVVEELATWRKEWERLRNNKEEHFGLNAFLMITKLLAKSQKTREISHIKAFYWTTKQGMHKGSSFEEEFDKGSDNCFYYWFEKLVQDGEAKAKEVIPFLYHVMRKEKNEEYRKVQAILFTWFKTFKFKEFWIFGIQIILISLRKPEKVMIMVETEALEVNEKDMELDDYCIDMHTRKGKNEGKDGKEFALEGSKVENEWQGTNQKYKDCYVKSKLTFE